VGAQEQLGRAVARRAHVHGLCHALPLVDAQAKVCAPADAAIAQPGSPQGAPMLTAGHWCQTGHAHRRRAAARRARGRAPHSFSIGRRPCCASSSVFSSLMSRLDTPWQGKHARSRGNVLSRAGGRQPGAAARAGINHLAKNHFQSPCSAHHLVAVVQREHQLLKEPARVLLAQPLPAPSMPGVCAQWRVLPAPERSRRGGRGPAGEAGARGGARTLWRRGRRGCRRWRTPSRCPGTCPS